MFAVCSANHMKNTRTHTTHTHTHTHNAQNTAFRKDAVGDTCWNCCSFKD